MGICTRTALMERLPVGYRLLRPRIRDNLHEQMFVI